MASSCNGALRYTFMLTNFAVIFPFGRKYEPILSFHPFFTSRSFSKLTFQWIFYCLLCRNPYEIKNYPHVLSELFSFIFTRTNPCLYISASLHLSGKNLHSSILPLPMISFSRDYTPTITPSYFFDRSHKPSYLSHIIPLISHLSVFLWSLYVRAVSF